MTSLAGRTLVAIDGRRQDCKNAMKLGAGGREWDFEAKSHSGQNPSRLGGAGGQGNLGRVPPGPMVSRRRCFGFRSRPPAKDVPLYSPDEEALRATGA